VSNKSDLYKPGHQSEQLHRNIGENVTIGRQPVICRQQTNFGAGVRETSLLVMQNVGQLPNVMESTLFGQHQCIARWLSIKRKLITFNQYSQDIEKFADLLNVAIVNLKKAKHTMDGMLYMKLQQKLPAVMLASYHRWFFENHKLECVEVLQEYVV